MVVFLIYRTYVLIGGITKKMVLLFIIEHISESALFFRTLILNQLPYLYIKIPAQLILLWQLNNATYAMNLCLFLI